ncbi:MLX-interacting protein [Sarcoptes scabiei]|uniref:Transmembrane protein 192 n=1 Tax=Sarcoptes scabiei TaxID=52283 RepID=A0A834V975_SARSC|nr:MLX-interacting protein [Sarcoptes scabiei]
MDDNVRILTLPYTNDLYAVHNSANNLKVLVILVAHYLIIIINWIFSFVFPLHEFQVSHEDEKSLISSPKTISFPSSNTTAINLFNPYNSIIFSHTFVWLLSILIRYYLKNFYYHRLRILGYHNHHRMVERYVHLPTSILHISNVLLLLATLILHHYDEIDILNIHLEPINVAQSIVSIASITILINIKITLYHEIRFRRFRNPPDVFCVDDPSRRLTSDGLNQVVIRSSSFLEDLLENQADLIYNLKLQNTHLRELLFNAMQNSARDPSDNADAN